MCLPNARYVLHQVYGSADGPAIDIQIAAREVERQKNSFNELLAQHTGRQVRKIERDTERDFFLDAHEAIDYGLVDKVIQRHPAAEKAPK